MIFELRKLHLEEFDAFMRYLERAFGHSKEFFLRRYPHVYRPTEETCSWTYVILENGKIMSHVGLYPIETRTCGLPLVVGGIGGVSTAPEARGKGYMTRLLNHVIHEMRRTGYPVSWLSGDRQRYGNFGWDYAAPAHTLQFTRRSLEWNKIEAVELDEVMGYEALETVRQHYQNQDCYTRRPHLERYLERTDLRFFIADDGYGVLVGQERHHIRVLECVSTSGNELGYLKALLDWNYGEQVDWTLSRWDKAKLTRLLPAVAYSTMRYSGLYRINDLTGLLLAAKPTLETKASALRDFDISIGIAEQDRTQITTIAVNGGKLSILPGGHNKTYVEVTPTSATRLLLGGLPIPEIKIFPQGLRALLPVPVYIMPWDEV